MIATGLEIMPGISRETYTLVILPSGSPERDTAAARTIDTLKRGCRNEFV
jgi:hypothetical protein